MHVCRDFRRRDVVADDRVSGSPAFAAADTIRAVCSLSPFPGFKTLSGKSNAFHEKPAVLAKVPAKSWLSAMQGCIRLVQLNTQLCDTFCTVLIMFVWLPS